MTNLVLASGGNVDSKNAAGKTSSKFPVVILSVIVLAITAVFVAGLIYFNYVKAHVAAITGLKSTAASLVFTATTRSVTGESFMLPLAFIWLISAALLMLVLIAVAVRFARGPVTYMLSLLIIIGISFGFIYNFHPSSPSQVLSNVTHEKITTWLSAKLKVKDSDFIIQSLSQGDYSTTFHAVDTTGKTVTYTIARAANTYSVKSD
jgi:hypothetical protein